MLEYALIKKKIRKKNKNPTKLYLEQLKVKKDLKKNFLDGN